MRGRQHLDLQQPACGTSYVIGKLEVGTLIAERRRHLGDGVSLRGVMNEYTAAAERALGAELERIPGHAA